MKEEKSCRNKSLEKGSQPYATRDLEPDPRFQVSQITIIACARCFV